MEVHQLLRCNSATGGSPFASQQLVDLHFVSLVFFTQLKKGLSFWNVGPF